MHSHLVAWHTGAQKQQGVDALSLSAGAVWLTSRCSAWAHAVYLVPGQGEAVPEPVTAGTPVLRAAVQDRFLVDTAFSSFLADRLFPGRA